MASSPGPARRWLLACGLVAAVALLCLPARQVAASVGPATAELLATPLTKLLTPAGLAAAVRQFWAVVGPGGELHPTYFLEHKGHLVVEAVLLLVIAYLFLQHAFQPAKPREETLTDKEIEQLCRDWKPEPLVPTVPEPQKVRPRMITGYDGKYIVADGRRALNLATHNFLGLSGKPEQKAVADATINKYGVGSCGPRGFYGTIDVHLQLEEELAKFMGVESAIIYSFDTATVTSIIPCFASRKDILVVDEACCFAIQQGISLSRASALYFKHNDMADLERVLKQIDARDKKLKKPLTRKLLVVEGIYANTGELAPLDQLIAIKEKYKYRLLVDESLSFGVLGATGRGAVEHWGLRTEQVEVVCGSMATALGSVGGFCVGNEESVEHQRLSSNGYCFSASLPPFLATAASTSLATLGKHAKQLIPRVQRNATALRRALRTLPGLKVLGPDADISPLIHLQLSNAPGSRDEAELLLSEVADRALAAGLLVNVARYSDLERVMPPPSLVLSATAELDDADIEAAVDALGTALKGLVA